MYQMFYNINNVKWYSGIVLYYRIQYTAVYSVLQYTTCYNNISNSNKKVS
jgi:hypothetical protein